MCAGPAAGEPGEVLEITQNSSLASGCPGGEGSGRSVSEEVRVGSPGPLCRCSREGATRTSGRAEQGNESRQRQTPSPGARSRPQSLSAPDSGRPFNHGRSRAARPDVEPEPSPVRGALTRPVAWNAGPCRRTSADGGRGPVRSAGPRAAELSPRIAPRPPQGCVCI